jgi:hypothetical protein
MITWAREVLFTLRKIVNLLEKIEANQRTIMREGRSGKKFVATGPHNS